MNSQANRLLVEVFLEGARIHGYSTQVEMRRRLSEVLNSSDEVLELAEATVTPATSDDLHVSAISIEKPAIVAAIPWETREQNRQRALATSMTGRARTVQIPVVILSPPLIVQGTAHVPGGFGTSRPRLDPGMFSHFFSVTNATILFDSGDRMETPVVLVNRERISALARSAEPTGLRLVA